MKIICERIPGIRSVIITDVRDKNVREFFNAFVGGDENLVYQIPRSGYMSALLAVVPLQRIAYDMTIA